MSRPPCWPVGQPCPNPCAAALYDRTVYNRQHLSGPWTGWRMAGRDLISPDGDRISPERLRGLLWRQQAEAKLAAAQTRRKSGSAGGSVSPADPLRRQPTGQQLRRLHRQESP